MAEWSLPVDYRELQPWEIKEVREQYIREQDGKCAHCKGALGSPPIGPDATKWIDRDRFPETFFKYPVHLHHCHRGGKTIGAVHNHCNAALWQYHGE